MNEVSITVRGSDRRDVPAEHAILTLAVGVDGPERAEVVERTLRLAEPVRTALIARSEAGTLLDWSSGQLIVHADRPWNTQGTRLALVHRVRVEFTATFDDISELADWVTEVSQREHVEIGGVRWDLSPATRARVERDVAASAVHAAVVRAEAYAAALGRSTVVAMSIADTGLLGHDHGMRAMSLAGSAEHGASMQYEPEDITIEASVEARFVAT